MDICPLLGPFETRVEEVELRFLGTVDAPSGSFEDGRLQEIVVFGGGRRVAHQGHGGVGVVVVGIGRSYSTVYDNML